MRSKLDFSLCLISALVFAGALLRATNWPFAAAVFPLAATAAGLALALSGLIAPLFGASRDIPGTTGAGLSRKEAITFGWIFSFFVLVALLGFQWGLPIATLLYLKLEGKAANLPSVIYAAGSWLFLYAAQAWLHLPLYEGFVFLGWF
jgi:hypothetical protein